MAKQKQAKNVKPVKAGQSVKVEGIRISKERPNATVKFKVTKADRDGNMTVRATMRGEKPIFIRAMAENGVRAGVRGDAPVAGRDPAQAFEKAVKRHWA